MKWDNQLAATKHPKGTATFCIRLCTDKGTRYQNLLKKPLQISEMLIELEDLVAFIRQYFPK